MSGRIPENIIEDILSRIDIIELISGYIPLKRAGRNFKALCPFHHEKTPSFMVSPERQIYHCFGCSVGGNAISFLMRYERMEFHEAVEILAKKAGVVLPDTQRQDYKTTSVVTQLYKINELANLFYESILNSPEGLHAKNYLLKRGIKPETIKLFKLGFAPDKPDALINYLRSKNISISLLEKAGLVIARQEGGYYDRFRRRVIFPILDIKSRILGFGARLLPSANTQEDKVLAKYVNSPETSIYSKGKNLYGLNFSKDAIRQNDYVVVVEGYLDFIAPYQLGFTNIVASQGTALTIDQARLLKRYTHNVVMVYDPDVAGQSATLRSLDIFIEEGMNVRIVSLPEGFDPDLFVRKYGIERFKQLIDSSDNLFDYKLKILKFKYNVREIEGKARISAEMLSTINKFKNAILRSEYIKKLADQLSIKEDVLLEELKKIKQDRAYVDLNIVAQKRFQNIHPTEKMLIKFMLEEEKFIKYIKQHLEPADFQGEETSKIVSIIYDLYEQGKSVELHNLMNYFDDESISKLISESAFLSDLPSSNREKVIDDCIRRLKNNRLILARQRLQEEIKIAEDLGDETRLSILQEEFYNLIKKR